MSLNASFLCVAFLVVLSFSFSFSFLNFSPIVFKRKRVCLPWHDILNLNKTLVLNCRSSVSTASLEATNHMSCEYVLVPVLQRQASARSVDEDAGDYCFLGPRTSM